MAIGDELLDIPFADMLRNLAFAIAEGQLALDRSSIETLQFLANNRIDLVPEVFEVIEPAQQTVQLSGGQPLTVNTVNIRSSGATPVSVSLLQAGLQPTFYQFTEAQIEVKLSITIKRTESTQPASSAGSPGTIKVRGYTTRAFASSVNYRTSNTYSYTAQGASVMRATIRPVPPPARVTPRTITINTLTTPPTVTVTE